MKTNTTQTPDEGARGQSEQSGTRKWNVIMDGEVIGSVHGQTIEQAKDTIAVLRMPNVSIQPD